MAKGLRRLHLTLLRAFLLRGKVKVLPVIPSEQLQAGLYSQELTDSKGLIRVPHYWARFIHDGRGPSPGAAGSKILVWFRDPKDDPRYPGGVYPVRRSDVKRLTRGQFRKWSRINQRIINGYRRLTGKRTLTAADYRAMNLPMIIAKNSPGNRGRVIGVPFFSNAPGGGMFGFRKEMNIVGKRIVGTFVTQELQSRGLLDKTIKKTINF